MTAKLKSYLMKLGLMHITLTNINELTVMEREDGKYLMIRVRD